MDLSTAQGRREWLLARKTGIGGSEAATLFNRPGRIVNRWQSPYSLWLSKVTDMIDESDSPRLKWGRRLEDVVRRAYEEDVGRKVTEGAILARGDEDFMLADTDGLIEPVPEYSGPGIYEGKTTKVWSGHDWRQGVPLLYQVQLQHYIAVQKHEWGSFACLEMGADDPFHWGDQERNDRFISALKELEYKFWTRHVLAEIPPPIDGGEATTKALKLLHPQDNGKVIFLPPEAGGWLVERAELGKEIKVLAERKAEIDNKLRAELGPATYGELPEGEGGVSYKTQKAPVSAEMVFQVVGDLLGKQDAAAVRREVNAKRGTMRVLRLVGAKTLRAAKEQDDEDRSS